MFYSAYSMFYVIISQLQMPIYELYTSQNSTYSWIMFAFCGACSIFYILLQITTYRIQTSFSSTNGWIAPMFTAHIKHINTHKTTPGCIRCRNLAGCGGCWFILFFILFDLLNSWHPITNTPIAVPAAGIWCHQRFDYAWCARENCNGYIDRCCIQRVNWWYCRCAGRHVRGWRGN